MAELKQRRSPNRCKVAAASPSSGGQRRDGGATAQPRWCERQPKQLTSFLAPNHLCLSLNPSIVLPSHSSSTATTTAPFRAATSARRELVTPWTAPQSSSTANSSVVDRRWQGLPCLPSSVSFFRGEGSWDALRLRMIEKGEEWVGAVGFREGKHCGCAEGNIAAAALRIGERGSVLLMGKSGNRVRVLRIVESVGDGVSNLKPGDHVLPLFTGECGECPHCKSEDSNMCEVLRINPTREGMISDGKSRFSTIKGKEPISHFLGTSTFSQYTVVHSGSVVKINPTLPLDKACLLSCGISTGIGSILNVAKPKKGASIAIFGLGTVGLAAAEGAKIAGASRIIGIDKNPNKLEYAMKFGLTDFVNPEEHERPVHEVLKEMTNGGVDRCIECTGNINALMSAMEALHDGWGVAVLVGVPSGDAVFKTNPFNFLNEKTITGTTFGNYKPKTGLPTLVDMFMNNKLELGKFITHRVPLSEINKAFDYMIKGQGLRTIIDMND
ncbi:hypothetical protein Ahy_B02g060623 isoform C [Arachis hypogaea]|uniref:Enoyl reductase (ER) domain-containing protein n=1 Tax=Arachis hypogaea TaxID=3818 RepID=A0A445AIW5_ARAHY|nr:hypothetical protein Ahy_B02g060623 isoform C [Arachis hypogaea]